MFDSISMSRVVSASAASALLMLVLSLVSAPTAAHAAVAVASPEHSARLARIHGQMDANNLTLSFKVCGYYCGPGWCSNEWIAETECVSTGVWGIAPESGETCTDGCCRWHDHCCGSGDRSSCNAGIVQCLDNGDCNSACAWAVWAAMKVVTEWCCGSSCPTFFDTKGGARQMSLHGQSFCSAEAGLRVGFDAHNGASVSALRGDGVPAEVTACGAKIPFALNQTSNRVAIGGSESAIAIPAECLAASASAEQRLLRVDLRDSSKVWYFPNTDELYVKNSRTKDFMSFKKC